jgi:putative SOS response-associated peptidase YedK
MCGRFTQAYTWAEVHAALNVFGAPPDNMRPRFNVTPTTTVDVIVARGAARELAKKQPPYP